MEEAAVCCAKVILPLFPGHHGESAQLVLIMGGIVNVNGKIYKRAWREAIVALEGVGGIKIDIQALGITITARPAGLISILVFTTELKFLSPAAP